MTVPMRDGRKVERLRTERRDRSRTRQAKQHTQLRRRQRAEKGRR